ncbi:hypothetical protein SAMN05443639_12664 [Stigmatella erecta]|uniref:non-specific serine/threonine protein kinase n=1 Tax=Stigmatella erecta TaxID=83460 RepID=A0A1I0LDZ4_9BACT|nr:hypothetical protein SAMN05443639_12664 [Stigmatella erecta]
MVSPEEKAFLMDFGCGTWAGAPPLTEGLLAPGTKPYRSPEALRFQWEHRREPHAPYRATPEDDVYALGVTAYHLCTGIYSPPATDPSLVGDDARETLEVMKPPGQLKPLAPSLESLILRMLSENSQDRGSAGELAAALETAAATAGPAADKPLRPSGSRMSAQVRKPPASEPRGGCLGPMVLMPLAAWLIILILGNLNLTDLTVSSTSMDDAGTAGVAGAAVEELPMPSTAREPEPSGLALEMPKAPLPGQRRPPCPRFQINIHGGCWLEVTQASPPCGEHYYDWKGACYSPTSAPPRPSTSDKP